MIAPMVSMDAEYSLGCRHMRTFAQALKSDENGASDEALSPQVASPLLGPYPGGQRVRKVSALSDFAPVNQRVKR